MKSRRRFLKTSTLAGAAAGLGDFAWPAPSAEGAEAAAPEAPPSQLSLVTRAGYGLGSLASGIAGTVLAGSVLQVYFNQVIGLPAAWVGAAISLGLVGSEMCIRDRPRMG